MDIQSIFNAGGIVVKNPNYKKGKNNTQPEYITVSDLDAGVAPNGSLTADIAYNAAASGNQRILGRNGELDKYIEYGLTPNGKDNLDAQLEDAQSNWTKAFNAAAQSVVSIIGLGTLKSFADIFDFTTSKILHITEDDYQNPVSETIEEWQNNFDNKIAPIYVDPEKNIQNGGLLDMSWYLKGIPNVVSTLMLLLPAKGISTITSAFLKGTRTGRSITHGIGDARRWVTGVKKAESAADLTKWQAAINNIHNVEKANKAFQITGEALLMRTAENYQESRQTYKDVYDLANEKLAEMDDATYKDFVNNNPNIFDDKNLDKTNKDEVAKFIARKSADRTFAMDWTNIIFDVIQLYGLKNIGKGYKIKNDRTINKLQQESVEEAGKIKAKSKLSAKPESSAKPTSDITNDPVKASNFINKTGAFSKKVVNNFKDFTKNISRTAVYESNEAVEEGINYIAQQEGITYGKMLLAAKKDDYDTSLTPNIIESWTNMQGNISDYLATPELQESAFWGLMGGVAFSYVGSAANKGQLALERKRTNDKLRKNPVTGEMIPKSTITELFENNDTKIARTVFNKRTILLNDLQNKLDQIKDGKNPYSTPDQTTGELEEFQGDNKTREIQQEIAKARAISEFRTQLAADAIDSGTYDYLIDYFKSDEVKSAMIELGVIDANEANSFIDETIRDMNSAKDEYNRQSAHVLNQISFINAKIKKPTISDDDNITDTETDISPEYARIIARENFLIGRAINAVNDEINKLGIVEAKEIEFLKNQNYNISFEDAKQAINVGNLITVYTRLSEQEEQLESSNPTTTVNRIEKFNQLENIKRQKKAILTRLKNSTMFGEDTGISNVYNAILFGSRAKNEIRIEKHRDTLSKKALKEMIITDEQIMKDVRSFFGKDGSTVSDESIIQSAKANTKYLNSLLDPKDSNSINKKSVALFNAFIKHSELAIQKELLSSALNNTTDQIRERVNYYHNTMNEVRDQKITYAEGIIRKAIEQYDGVIDENTNSPLLSAVIEAYKGNIKEARKIAENTMASPGQDAITASEFIDALNILALHRGSNKNVAIWLERTLKRRGEEIEQEREKQEKENTTDLQSDTGENGPFSEDSSPKELEAKRQEENGQNEPILPKNHPQNQENQNNNINRGNVQITINESGKIVAVEDKNQNKKDEYFPVFYLSDDSIMIDTNNLTTKQLNDLINAGLFDVKEGVDFLAPGKTWYVENNPTFKINNNKYQAVERGKISNLTEDILNDSKSKLNNKSTQQNEETFQHDEQKNDIINDSKKTKSEIDNTTSPIEVNKDVNFKVKEVLDRIHKDSEELELTDDEVYYENTNTGQLNARVTSTISADEENVDNEGKPIKHQPGVWDIPSTNIGTGIDEFVRDFFLGKFDNITGDISSISDYLEEHYPNAKGYDLFIFREQLIEFRNKLANGELVKNKKVTIVSRDVKAVGVVDVHMPDGTIKKLNVAGTLDLLGYDEEGNFYVFDMKTIHSDKRIEDNETRKKWARQLQIYKQFLQDKYDIKVKGTYIIPIKVNYDTPVGATYKDGTDMGGTAKYEVKDPEEHRNYENPNRTQLLQDGKEFKEASPKLRRPIELVTHKGKIKYEFLDDSAKALLDNNNSKLREKTKSNKNEQNPLTGEEVDKFDFSNETNGVESAIDTVIVSFMPNLMAEDIDFDDIKLRTISAIQKQFPTIDEDEIERYVNIQIANKKAAREYLKNIGSSLFNSAANAAYTCRLVDSETNTFNKIFEDAIVKFLDEYSKILIVKEIDGRKVIKLEDLLRLCKKAYVSSEQDSYNFFNVIKNYLNTHSDKYIILDNNVSVNSIFNNINKTSSQIASSSEENNEYRINIRDIIESNSDQNYFNEFNKLKVGDTLDLSIIDGKLHFSSNGVTIGFMSKPSIVNNVFYQLNQGWITDVSLDGNGRPISKTMNIFKDLFLGDSNNHDELREILTRIIINNDTITSDDIEDFKNNILIYKLTQQALEANKNKEKHTIFGIDKNNNIDYKKALLHLVRLWKYTNQGNIDITKKAMTDNVRNNLSIWFANLYDNYNEIYKINSPQKVTITKKTGSRPINVVDYDTYNCYEQLPFSNEAISSESNPKLSIAVSDDTIRVSGTDNITIRGYIRGSVNVVLYNQEGEPNLVKAYGLRLNDESAFSNSVFRSINLAVFDHIYDVITRMMESNDKNYDELYKSLRAIFSTFDDTESVSLFRATNGNFRLEPFRLPDGTTGITINYFNKTGNAQRFRIYNKTSRGAIFGFSYGKSTGYIFNSNDVDRIKETKKQFITTLANFISDKASLNIDKNGINLDNLQDSNNAGFITRKNGKTIIDIPSKGNSFHEEYNSYSDFLITNGLLRVNTKKSKNGSNFEYFGRNQKLNSTILVSLPKSDKENLDFSSPIVQEENANNTISSNIKLAEFTDASNYNSLANALSSSVSGEELLGYILSKDELDLLKSISDNNNLFISQLLPNFIVYDNNLNDYNLPNISSQPIAATSGGREKTIYPTYENGKRIKKRRIKGKGNTVVGPRFINMAASSNLQSRKNAFKVLLHEKLHTIFQSSEDRNINLLKKLESIFDEFTNLAKEDINTSKLSQEDKNRLIEFLQVYNNYKLSHLGSVSQNQTPTYRHIEEFLVDSLTNGFLNNYLNNKFVENARDNKKTKSIFEKIFDVIAEFFGWNKANDGSLFMKELNTIRDYFDNSNIANDSNNLENINDITQNDNVQNDEIIEEYDAEDDYYYDPDDSSFSVIEDAIDSNNRLQISNVFSLKNRLPLPVQPLFDASLRSGSLNITCK